MKKKGKRKLALSKETIALLEAGKLTAAEAGGTFQEQQAFSDNWQQTTCV